MKQIAFLSACCCLFACNSPALPYREAPTKYFPVHFYVENGSETQPTTDLRIDWDTTVVAQDTFRYTGIGDLFDTYSLSAKSGLHRIKVTNNLNRLVRDTTIQVDTLTHVFISFTYNKLDAATVRGIREQHPPEGEEVVINALSMPKQLSVHIMRGHISIP